MEQLKDDPYYIIDDNLKASEDVDVDSIPVVHLDDMPSLQTGQCIHSMSWTCHELIITQIGKIKDLRH